jgi:hypothetical protein
MRFKTATHPLANQRQFTNSPALPMRASGSSFQSVPPIDYCCGKIEPLPIPRSGEMHSPSHGKSLGSLYQELRDYWQHEIFSRPLHALAV